jgi:hypothetical protein
MPTTWRILPSPRRGRDADDHRGRGGSGMRVDLALRTYTLCSSARSLPGLEFLIPWWLDAGWVSWSEARCVPLVDVWVLPETGCTRTASGVRIARQVVGVPPLDVLLVGPRRRHMAATWEIPARARFNGGLASFSPADSPQQRGLGLSDPCPASSDHRRGRPKCRAVSAWRGAGPTPMWAAGRTRCDTSTTTRCCQGARAAKQWLRDEKDWRPVPLRAGAATVTSLRDRPISCRRSGTSRACLRPPVRATQPILRKKAQSGGP